MYFITHAQTKQFVSGVNHDIGIITFSDKPRKALRFKSESEMNKWLDDYVNEQFKFGWSNVKCFEGCPAAL